MDQSGQVVVVGGGAAGLMAAGQAAIAGARVLLLERTARLGTKLRITGKGRCNLTNTAELDDFIQHFAFSDQAGMPGSLPGSDSHLFVRNVFARFFAPDLMVFFEDLGVATVVERGGRVFPASSDRPAGWVARTRWQRHSSVSLGTRVCRSGFGAESLALLHEDDRLLGVALEGGSR